MASLQGNNKSSEDFVQEFRGQVLNWYDRHARILPWRAVKGQKAQAYHVWLSEIMLQQTTVGAVIPYFTKFIETWPDVQSLADAGREDVMSAWAGLGYYARARNLHECAGIVANDLSGVFPQDQAELKKLPGIGDYTSAAIASIAFDKPAVVVDGNIERVMARFFALRAPLPAAKKQLKELAGALSEDQTSRPGDYAQGLMDLGAGICTVQSPKCGLCPLSGNCQGRAQGIAQELPVRAFKKDKPQKIGFVYWIEDKSGRVLLHRRPSKGMLGGMVGLPTSDWIEGRRKPEHLDVVRNLKLKTMKQNIHHSFTHFDLKLSIQTSIYEGKDVSNDAYFWCHRDKLEDTGFPTLFGKAVKLMA